MDARQGARGGLLHGATTTSLRALRHEVFHMYYGCSAVARTYRDSWWDEAINRWYEDSKDPACPPAPESFQSDIVSGRSPVAAGFDDRAYVEGAEVMQAVAIEMGGRDRMVSFLRDLRVRRSFDPFDTWDLADEIGGWSGHSVRERFRSWLYTPGGGAAASRSSPWPWLHQVDMSLPEARRPR